MALEEEIKSLYTYRVPEQHEDGTCSVTGALRVEPYSLASRLLGMEPPVDWSALALHPHTIRLSRLRELVRKLRRDTGVQWLGVYRIVAGKQGSPALVKEAYDDDPPSPSRAEFPLTAEFEQKSNNVRVALSGKAILIQDVEEHRGPYYQCDGRVQSEFCCPILSPSGRCIGIIDSEAHAKRHFTAEHMALIEEACRTLGSSPDLLPDKYGFYKELGRELALLLGGDHDVIANAANTAAMLYSRLSDVNWAGFYFWKDSELVLGPFQGKPACVRIQLGKGVCGTAARLEKPVVVPDVSVFPGHIACDVESRSELVVPLLRNGTLLGVLDLDSAALGRFDEEDREGCEALAAIYLKSLESGF
jgi:L-methionine (R)-S-oxide reductase